MTVWTEVAEELRGLVSEGGADFQLYRVLRQSPLRLEQLDGDAVLEEGDEDFTVTDAVKEHRAKFGLAGATVRVVAVGDEYLAMAVESAEDVSTGGAQAEGQAAQIAALEATVATLEEAVAALLTIVTEAGIVLTEPGAGYQLVSPDGAVTRTLRIDNTGTLVVEA